MMATSRRSFLGFISALPVIGPAIASTPLEASPLLKASGLTGSVGVMKDFASSDATGVQEGDDEPYFISRLRDIKRKLAGKFTRQEKMQQDFYLLDHKKLLKHRNLESLRSVSLSSKTSIALRIEREVDEERQRLDLQIDYVRYLSEKIEHISGKPKRRPSRLPTYTRKAQRIG